jgi:hypothetical protein
LVLAGTAKQDGRKLRQRDRFEEEEGGGKTGARAPYQQFCGPKLRDLQETAQWASWGPLVFTRFFFYFAVLGT